MFKNSEKIVWVDFNTLESFMVDVFKGVKVPEEEAKICADVLITADKRGIDSHGIGRLKPFYYDRIRAGIQSPKTNIEIVKDSPTTAVVDGHNGMGMVIAKKSMALAIEKAKKMGLGMVAVRNSTHYGIAGYYVLMAIEAGMIGISGTNARPSIAPTFGVENMLGTNPLTFGMPSNEEFPFVLDCATSIAQRGKIELYDRAGKDIPAGWVIDQEGRARTDTHQILQDLTTGKAALTPLGGIGEETAGYKGYGYATVVEILSAALQNGKYLKMLSGMQDGQAVPINLGHFFIAINISAFTELESFKKITGGILGALRASKKAPGENRIYTAGEKEHLAWLDRKDKGAPINKNLQQQILVIKEELGLSQYKFPFEGSAKAGSGNPE
ncbi:MAG: lactate dehydrogenase [Candidatus Infernicultor aquiphilus]|uniref:Lactate dehydrogenase n=2 Tax=Candidatus Infernicultor aquiphilus TaxID=1805029 RepID=A0A1J5GBL3_9BACT|nr:MAG: lactate dehydrogenase [Candidatus Atribacteria bacterium CG2_30_33_13]PIU25152.1 MAG: lactate dehydrogenase [Candidatus Atribacteria bacterium CG08_land_8_20_14_0_20_33_29]PIX34113.1 MAG: lactate dehydrogenase [Candidatus Atribacteria bacterium CG_4_8_14_3_um_filter_34_18]